MRPEGGAREVYARARDAIDRVERDEQWHVWLMIGEGLVQARRDAMTRAHTDNVHAQRYRDAMSAILREEGLDDPKDYPKDKKSNKVTADPSLRSRLLEVMDNLPDIERWRMTLTVHERANWNYPKTVLQRWRKATAVPKPKPDDGEETEARPSYKTALAAAETEITVLRQRLKSEGSLFNIHMDTPKQIARAVVGNVAPTRAENIAREILAEVRSRKTKGGHAG